MNSMLFSTAHTPIQCLFAGDMSPYSQRLEYRMFLLFCTRTATNSILFCMNFYRNINNSSFFFFGWCYSYGPQQGPDRQQKKKRREGSSRGESKRKLLKETQNQRKETRKKKKTQVEYRVEGAQDRRRRRKPGGWKETPNTRKRGGDAQSCSC